MSDAAIPSARSLPAPTALWRRWELPTWGVALAIYGGWAALIWWHAAIPWPLEVIGGAYLLAWHFSLQHEAIHGWRSLPRWLRTAIVWPPIGGWFPFELYKRSHTSHHRNTVLTYPGEDTESQYHRRDDWSRYSRPWRAVLLFNQTLLGRLLVGPFIRLRKLVIIEGGMLLRGDYRNVRIWLGFFAGLAVVLFYVSAVCGMPVWRYYLLYVLPGLSLGLLRAFIEHRWGDRPGERTASVESNPVFGLLFLYNNLHIVHHLYPAMPWFEIPGFWRANRERLLHHNGHFVFRGYWQIARRWLLRPVFVPVHPTR